LFHKLSWCNIKLPFLFLVYFIFDPPPWDWRLIQWHGSLRFTLCFCDTKFINSLIWVVIWYEIYIYIYILFTKKKRKKEEKSKYALGLLTCPQNQPRWIRWLLSRIPLTVFVAQFIPLARTSPFSFLFFNL
jgi:hypothetical protein